MLPVLAGIGVIAVITVVKVSGDLKRIEAGGGAIDRATIDHLAGAISSGPSFHLKIIFVLVIVIWLFSIIDAYRLGRKAEPPY